MATPQSPRSLSNLPPEITLRIISFLSPDNHVCLAPFAALSRSWQSLIEARTFATLRLRSTELDAFAQYVVGARQHVLRLLCYEIALGVKEEKDEEFTRQVRALLEVLRGWDEKGKEGGECAFSMLLSANAPFIGSGNTEERAQRHSVKIVGGDGMPKVKAVRSLTVQGQYPMRIHGASTTIIAGLLTRLEELKADVCDNEHLDLEWRQTHRKAFAAALLATRFSALHTLRLEFDYEPPGNHSFRPASIIPATATSLNHDPFSLALRHLAFSAPYLTSLTLGSSTGVSIAPSAFWPTHDVANTREPRWSHLRHMDVLLSPVAPDGSWLYHNPEHSNEEPGADTGITPDEDDDEDWDASIFPTPLEQRRALATGAYPPNFWRSTPYIPTIRALFVAAARAAGQMPELRTMSVRVWHAEGVPCRMGFSAAGEEGWLELFPGEGEDDGDSMSADRAGLVVSNGATVDEMEGELERLWKEGKGDGLEWRVVRRDLEE